MERTQIRAGASAVTDSAMQQGDYACRVNRCKNLRSARTASGEAVLQMVGRPTCMAAGAWEPLGVLTDAAGATLTVLRQGYRVYVVTDKVTDGIRAEPEAVGILPGDVVCCVQCGGRLLVSTAAGMVTVSAAEGKEGGAAVQLDVQAEAARFHGLNLSAVQHSVLTERVGIRRLGREYTASDTLPDSGDLSAMSSDLLAAYTAVCDQASATGCLIQPLVARYVVYDSEMRQLYSSAPVLLSGPGGTQCIQPLGIRSTDGRTLQPYDLQVPAWRVAITTDGSPLPAEAAVVSVKVTPQFHPVDQGRQASVNIVHGSGSEFARISLPGVTSAISADNAAASKSRVAAAISRLDTLEHVLAYIPVSRLAGGLTVEAGAGMPFAREQSVLESALAKPAKAAPGLLSLLQPPNSFVPTCGAAGPTAVLWGGLQLRRYGGYPAGMFTATRLQDASWHAWVKVDFADGHSVVWTGEGLSGAPLTFGPLLAYPAADAVKMTIGLKVAGQTAREQSFALQPDESLRWSLYIHPTFQPFALAPSADGVTVVPPVDEHVYDYSDWLAVASSETPTSLKAGRRTGNVKVRTILAAAGSQSAWDFGRPRFYALGSGGVLSVSANTGLTALAASVIDRRSLESAGAVTVIDGRCWAVLDGDLVRLQTQKAVTVRSACGYTALGWIGPGRELAALRADGRLEYTAFDFGMSRFETDCLPEPPLMLYDAGGRTLAATSNGLYDLSAEVPVDAADGMLSFEWVADISHKRGHAMRPRALFADMTAAATTATVSLHRSSLSHVAAEPDFGLTVSGPLRSPAGCRLLTRPALGWQLRLSGHGADVRLRAICLMA